MATFLSLYEASMPYFPHNKTNKKIVVEITVKPPTIAPSTGVLGEYSLPMLHPPHFVIFFLFAKN